MSLSKIITRAPVLHHKNPKDGSVWGLAEIDLNGWEIRYTDDLKKKLKSGIFIA